MKYFMMVCAAFVLLATGCGEEAVVQNKPPAEAKPSVEAKPPIEVMEVDKAELESTLASNKLTLVDFTAVW